ncbi:16795_t:CDS:2 [Gigaspora rosea]|nr:16795_t:CDS:2 [Gigaspora rosea]
MEMEISPFVLNKTRLVVISDQVVQITLSSKSSSSDSLYNHNQLMQDEIKKVVVAFVKLKEENLIVDGDGYKKHSWQYGRKYVFFKNKSRLKVHRYKYTFELEPLATDHEESTSSHIGKNRSVQQQQQKDDHESNLPQITKVFSNSDVVNTSFLSEGDVVGVEATPNRPRTQLTVHEISESSKSTASVRETNSRTEDCPAQSDITVESSNRILSVSGITAEMVSVASSDSHSSSTNVINNKREVSNEFNSDSAEGSTSLNAVPASESNLGKRKERSDERDYNDSYR